MVIDGVYSSTSDTVGCCEQPVKKLVVKAAKDTATTVLRTASFIENMNIPPLSDVIIAW